ncbi:MAG: sulfatase-like hydrolase/transferase [Gammaproteobacteria bacterium]|uniref:sulfatase-like hydrolase/transferase n=1 Tax=Pseudomaricurvus alcaniphilus TaxID=1166482 RepID=UPI001408C97B|nr:sulfatase-like hydrolase/transferase [Pseudomaricurvus alcaniphilus]MBR9911113.1 sulfatase-like hydrolase/transferase [Gammaproteobacteria bacterium]NHN36383.1 sulfatase-like hydrolase/transferase [Pseudomaricurvus alcaniphilus]
MSSLQKTLALLLICCPCWGLAATDRPNIIVMVADDLGWNDVGFHGGDIETPSLDRLAREGMQLNRFYTTPICSPTRAALMTGRDPMRLGVAYGVILPWDNNGVHPDEHFMPESFRAAGYQTAMVGKWHLGHAQMTYHPNQRGFEHFYGHLHTEVGFYPPFSLAGGKDFQQNGVSIAATAEGYETFLLADEVTRYIRQRDKQKPFFVYLPFIAPHTPLDAPQELQDKYKDINTDLAPARSPQTDRSRRLAKEMGRGSSRPMYAAVVDGMDQAIGRVLDTLDREGIADNTIVLFFSDNGGAAYAYGGADNAPLRGGKGETFEGGIRVVSLLRWPARLAPGGNLQQLMTVMDVFPTLAQAAGIDTDNRRPLDGRSLWPAIAAGQKMPRTDYVFFASEIPIYGHFNLTAFNDEWKLVQEVEQNQLSTRVTNHLFRIQDDPNEEHNLAAEYPQLVAQLSDRIQRWRALHPINGTRARLAPPPGWRAPLDWADYPMALEKLQAQPARSMAPSNSIERMVDAHHGERGRIIYDCHRQWTAETVCADKRKNEESQP